MAKAAADDAKLDFRQYALKLRSCHLLYWCIKRRQEQGTTEKRQWRNLSVEVQGVCSNWPASHTDSGDPLVKVGDFRFATLDWADILRGKDKDVLQPLFVSSAADFNRNGTVRKIAATLSVLRRDMPPSSSVSQPAALEEAFGGVEQALGADREQGEAHFSRDARRDLAKVLGVSSSSQSNAALGKTQHCAAGKRERRPRDQGNELQHLRWSCEGRRVSVP